MKLSFNYVPFPTVDPEKKNIIGQIFRPLIPVRIGYKYNLFRNPINALLDSGSDRNLFPSYVGEEIGIRIKKGKYQNVGGIGGVGIKAFTHPVKIFVGSHSFETFIDFSYEQQVPILGRIGFFNYFDKVIFKEKKRVIEIEVKQD